MVRTHLNDFCGRCGLQNLERLVPLPCDCCNTKFADAEAVCPLCNTRNFTDRKDMKYGKPPHVLSLIDTTENHSDINKIGFVSIISNGDKWRIIEYLINAFSRPLSILIADQIKAVIDNSDESTDPKSCTS